MLYTLQTIALSYRDAAQAQHALREDPHRPPSRHLPLHGEAGGGRLAVTYAYLERKVEPLRRNLKSIHGWHFVRRNHNPRVGRTCPLRFLLGFY